MDAGETLAGGNSSDVIRIGSTVHRGAGPWTARVHQLLYHLRSQGIVEAPEPLGFDEQGREILSFIPGLVGNDPIPESLRTDAILTAAARLLRRIHDATQDVALLWPSGWRTPARAPVEVICHGDFAPYNCVFDRETLVGVIDFDHAHPGSRAWDAAYAIYRFAPTNAPSNPDHYGDVHDQCRRARLFCDAYGMRDRSQMTAALLARVTAMANYLREGAASGDRRLQANVAAGHLDIYLNDALYLKQHSPEFEAALG
jgi:hypothetical protein